MNPEGELQRMLSAAFPNETHFSTGSFCGQFLFRDLHILVPNLEMMKLCWSLQNSVFLCDQNVAGSQDLTQKEAGPHFSQGKQTEQTPGNQPNRRANPSALR